MTIQADLQPFIEKMNQHALDESNPSVEALRQSSEDAARQARLPYPPHLRVTDHVVAGNKREVPVRLYQPDNTGDRQQACLMFMHGGGWVIGSIDTHDDIAAAIATQAAVTVVNVGYARAPEAPYPAAVEDCDAVLGWLFDNAESLGIDAGRMFVGGDSAGGNLATVMALLHKDDPAQTLRGQVLIYPCVDTDFSRSSYVTEANAPYLTANRMIWFWDQYCSDAAQRVQPTAAPIHATDVAGMAPALVMVNEHDPLRDEGQAYAMYLEQSGVPVTFRYGTGLIHGHLRARDMSWAASEEFRAMCHWVASQARTSR